MMKHIAFASFVPAEESWWIDASRQHFSEHALRQQDRMSRGRGATWVNPMPRWFIDKRREVPEDHGLFQRERAMMRAAEGQ